MLYCTVQLSRRLSRQLSTKGVRPPGKEDDKKEEEVEDEAPKVQMLRILKRNSPEYPYIFIGKECIVYYFRCK